MRELLKHDDVRIAAARIVGLVLCIAGFVVIGLGWNGMARVACPDCQLPYLLSGGAAGLALILVGVGLVVTAEIRVARRQLREDLGRLVDAVGGRASSSTQPTRLDAVNGQADIERSSDGVREETPVAR